MNPEAQLEEAVCVGALHITDSVLRAKFLDRACAGDARLRAAVEEMLRANDAAENFFDQCRAAVNVSNLDAQAAGALKETGIELEDLTDEQLGSRLGRYKLLQKIGEGGCGVVYLAEQEEPVRRQVALKVIKLGMDTKSVIARFEAERQALAMMDHPNIARVLDAGATEIGRPFFVMELVRGTRITKYCDENNLDTVQRLKLFIQVCRAIQHAHQKGVIHRDIKPSNILVSLHDGVPVPKVIDFGIAKATEGRLTNNTLLTAVEQFVGTPAYMSPEQADISGLDVDTRSDIYSLGVLLYELLTGRTPFDTNVLMQSGLDEMRRTLREKDPQLPSTMITSLRRTELTLTAGQRRTEPPKLISQIKGDLDWIVMKALEKDRNRRYDTANGLALDIQRYIESEPVLARPPSRSYRFKKLVRRNKIIFAAGGAVALALLIGLGMSTWLFFREREARFYERDAREREAQLRADAEDRAKITQAEMFVSQGKFDDADAMLNQVKNFPPNPTLDCASALRSVGEWQALQGHWEPARERYAALVKMDKLDSLNQIIFDYQAFSVVLAESGDAEQYGNFFQMAVTNFSANPNGSILIASLLLPLNKSQIEILKPLAAAAEKQLHALPRDRRSEWTFMPFCLWQYRCGNYEAAIHWCQNAQAQSSKFPCSDAIIHAVSAMAYYQTGQTNEACTELAQGRQLVDEKFKTGLDHGRPGSGFWYDWVYARHLSQEATALINCDSDKSATE
jgi:serine/threonine protein kinase